MKFATRILSLLTLAALTTFYVSCDKGGGEKQSEEEVQFGKLKSSWELVTANDGVDRTADFPNLVLTLTGTYAQGGTYNYSFTGTRPNPSPWPASGTWKFGTNVAQELIRDPGTANTELNMTYTVTGSSLIITFLIPDGHTGWAGGTSREKSVSGNWTFTFEKQ
jgi:hypothetical protein